MFFQTEICEWVFGKNIIFFGRFDNDGPNIGIQSAGAGREFLEMCPPFNR